MASELCQGKMASCCLAPLQSIHDHQQRVEDGRSVSRAIPEENEENAHIRGNNWEELRKIQLKM